MDQFKSDVCLSEEEKALCGALRVVVRINSLSGEDEHKWTVIIAVAITMSLRRAKNRNFTLASINCGRALSELIINHRGKRQLHVRQQ